MNETRCHFTNKYGWDFDLTATFGSMKRLENCNFDNVTKLRDFSFIEPTEDVLNELSSNSAFMMAAVYVMVQDQLKDYINIEIVRLGSEEPNAKNLLFKQRLIRSLENSEDLELVFLDGLTGSIKDRIRRAFYEGLSDFFPELASLLLGILETRERSEAKIKEEVEKRIPNVTAMIEREFASGLTPFLKKMDDEISNVEKAGT